MNIDNLINKRVYFLAKDYLAYSRFIIKNKMNSKKFFFISNINVIIGMLDNSYLYILPNWTDRYDEVDIIDQLKNKKYLTINNTDDLVLILNTIK